MKYMKLYFLVLLLIAIPAFVLGFIAPTMVSSPSDIGVMIGALSLVVALPLFVWVVNLVSKECDKLFNKKEGSEKNV